jgi:cysteine desulfurase family protein (TIGR01976 family)
MLDVERIRARFPALSESGPDGRPLVHADAPGGTQVVDTAIEAMTGLLRGGSANQHGHFATSVRTDALVDRVREQAGAFLGTEPEGVVFGPNMTSLTFHLARAMEGWLTADDEVVCTRLDHDANVAPWLRLAERVGATVRWVPLDVGTGRLDVAALDEVVGDRTKLVAFPAASNAFGTLVDPAPFVAAAGRVGAVTFVDAVHAVPHVPVDRRAWGVDVVACSPYKFFGPHAGLLAADPALLARLTPDKVRPSPDRGPERWQTGTASFEAIAGTGGALSYLEQVGMERVEAHEHVLVHCFLDGITHLGHVHLHGPAGAEARTPTFAVTVDGWNPDAVAEALAGEGINVWTGHYYAIEPMRAYGLLERGGAVRVGFVHHHGPDDVDRVVEALARLAR